MNRIAIKYGIILFTGQIIFFFIARAIGIAENNSLVIFNALLQLVIVYFAIREYRLSGKSSAGHYLSGVGMGMYAVALGALAFSIFLFIYLSADPTYFNALEEDAAKGAPHEYLTPVVTISILFGEAIVIGIIGSYILTRIIDMNLAHNNTNINSTEQ